VEKPTVELMDPAIKENITCMFNLPNLFDGYGMKFSVHLPKNCGPPKWNHQISKKYSSYKFVFNVVIFITKHEEK